MRRRLRNLLTGLSLLVCVAAAALWAGGITAEGAVPFHFRGVRWAAGLQAGRLCFDDTPQRQFERQQWSEEFSRLRAESKAQRRLRPLAGN